MIKHIAFTMYPVTDMARARKFYEDGLGLEFTKQNATGGWVEYHLENGAFALTTMAKGIAPSAKSGGSIAFEVDDLDAYVNKVTAAGGTIKVPPFASPVCHMAVALDTEGNALMLHKKKV
jgi:predicted enzyme related to lactoylglutathione lyase